MEELGWQSTPLGEITLRRRYDPIVQTDVYEVKLDDDFLMSSLFPVAEEELAHRALERLHGDALSVLVGGLGLGYTAKAALSDDRVADLTVMEYSDVLIDWNRDNLIPDTAGLAADPRTTLRCADFFASAAGEIGFDPDHPGRQYDAILLDIDHSPQHVLNESHRPFYMPSGLQELERFLAPDGIFAMWSDDPPEDEFMAVLDTAFSDIEAHRVWFHNPFTGGQSSNTVYLAQR